MPSMPVSHDVPLDELARAIEQRLTEEFSDVHAELMLVGLTKAWLALVTLGAERLKEEADPESNALFSAFVAQVAREVLELAGICPTCWRQHGTSDDVVH